MSLKVSDQWKEAIKGQFRYPGYLRVFLTLVPDEMRKKISINTNKTESITSTAQLTDSISESREPVATFEQNRWLGDGSQYLPSLTTSNNQEIEWWSNTVHFSEENPIELTFAFSNIVSFAGLNVAWDTETDSWPTDWEVIGLKDNVIKKRYRITTTSSSDEFNEIPMNDINSVNIKIYKWSKPNWRVRINEITFGNNLVFSNDQIVKADFTASASPIMDELPTCQLSFTFGNYENEFDPKLQEGYSKYLTNKQLVKAQWGFETSYGQIEWMDPWPLYLSGWKVPFDSKEVTLTAQSRLDFLDTPYIKGVYDPFPVSMYDLACEVLNNSGIIRERTNEIPWDVSYNITKFWTRAPLPMLSSKELLQLIANATGYVLDTDLRNGYVRIRPPVITTDCTMDTSQQLGDPSYEFKDNLKSIKIGKYSYNVSDTREEVYKSEIVLNTTTDVTCFFNSDQIVDSPKVTVTGGSFKKKGTYARAMILRIKPDREGQYNEITITIKGYVVEKSVTMLETYNDPKVSKGLEIEIDNELITERETVTLLTEILLRYYKRRTRISIPYVGYPEIEAGDRINISTNYGDSTVDVLSAKLSFNGGFNGTLETLSTDMFYD